MDVRVDQARNEKLSFSGNYPRASRLLRSCFSLDANDASVFDQHAAFLDVIELLWRNDADVSNPGSVRCLIWGRLSNRRHREKRRK
jgi:hypothetical protein